MSHSQEDDEYDQGDLQVPDDQDDEEYEKVLESLIVTTEGSIYKFVAQITLETINNDTIIYMGKTDKGLSCVMIVKGEYDPKSIVLSSLIWNEECCTFEGRPMKNGRGGTVAMAKAALTLAYDRFSEWEYVEFTDMSRKSFEMPASSLDLSRNVVRRGDIPLADYYVLTSEQGQTWYEHHLGARPSDSTLVDKLRDFATSIVQRNEFEKLWNECRTQAKLRGHSEWLREDVEPHIERFMEFANEITWRLLIQGLKTSFGFPMIEILFSSLPIALDMNYRSIAGTAWKIDREVVKSYGVQLIEQTVDLVRGGGREMRAAISTAAIEQKTSFVNKAIGRPRLRKGFSIST